MFVSSAGSAEIMAASWRWPRQFIVAILASAAACVSAGAAAPDDRDVAVRVGDASIARSAIDTVIRRLNPAALAAGEQRLQVEASVVEQLVDEAILRLELSRQLVGVAASEIDAGIERLKAQFVGKATTFEEFLARSGRDEPMLREQIALEIGLEKYVRQRLTPEAIEAAYATNRREVDGTRLRVSHVVLRPNILSDDGLERRLKQADGIRRDILQGRMTFEEAARRYSAGPSRHRGGDLGWIGRDGPLIDAFAKPVFAITRGDVSRPFITPYGIHIVKVTEMEAGRVGIGEARPRLEKMLAARLVRELVAEGRRATPVEYAMGVAHFDLATPADGPQPRRVVVDAAAVGN